jgi:hypothetical protein
METFDGFLGQLFQTIGIKNTYNDTYYFEKS